MSDEEASRTKAIIMKTELRKERAGSVFISINFNLKLTLRREGEKKVNDFKLFPRDGKSTQKQNTGVENNFGSAFVKLRSYFSHRYGGG